MSQAAAVLQDSHFQSYISRVFIVWWEKASLLAETRAAEQRAEKHFKNVLQLKV